MHVPHTIAIRRLTSYSEARQRRPRGRDTQEATSRAGPEREAQRHQRSIIHRPHPTKHPLSAATAGETLRSPYQQILQRHHRHLPRSLLRPILRPHTRPSRIHLLATLRQTRQQRPLHRRRTLGGQATSVFTCPHHHREPPHRAHGRLRQTALPPALRYEGAASAGQIRFQASHLSAMVGRHGAGLSGQEVAEYVHHAATVP